MRKHAWEYQIKSEEVEYQRLMLDKRLKCHKISMIMLPNTEHVDITKECKYLN